MDSKETERKVKEGGVSIVLLYSGRCRDIFIEETFKISEDPNLTLGQLIEKFPEKLGSLEEPKRIKYQVKSGLFHIGYGYSTIKEMIIKSQEDAQKCFDQDYFIKGRPAESYVMELYPDTKLILYVMDIPNQEKIKALKETLKDDFEKNKLRVDYRLYTSESPDYSIEDIHVTGGESNYSFDLDPENRLLSTNDLEDSCLTQDILEKISIVEKQLSDSFNPSSGTDEKRSSVNLDIPYFYGQIDQIKNLAKQVSNSPNQQLYRLRILGLMTSVQTIQLQLSMKNESSESEESESESDEKDSETNTSKVMVEKSSSHHDSSAESSSESEKEIGPIDNIKISHQNISSIKKWPRENASEYSAVRAPQAMFSHKPTSIAQELELMPLMGNGNITEDNCFMPCVIL